MLAHPFFSKRMRYIDHFVLMTCIQILNFVNKMFVILRIITKFMKILCHDNLELYGTCTYMYSCRPQSFAELKMKAN